MSKLSFRARALDANKSLPVYHADDLPDLPDITSVSRVVPQMPTGMEKEEESEHHLQRAISAQQIYGEAQRLIIPTPETTLNAPETSKQNARSVQMPKQLIHVQAFTLEDELPDYDCDDDDIQWLNQFNKKNKAQSLSSTDFEKMIDTLERGCGSQIELFTLGEARLLLKKDDAVVKAVFEYWKSKRLKVESPQLTPSVRTEKKDGAAIHDPYIAFRRRVEKMQTRKNRKNDEASYEKMLKLRRDLNRACLILEMVKLREEKKRDLLGTTLNILETRYSNKDFQGELLMQCYDLLKQRQMNKDARPSTSSVPAATAVPPASKPTIAAAERIRDSVEERLKRSELADEARKRHNKVSKPRPLMQAGDSLQEKHLPSQTNPLRTDPDGTEETDGPDGKYSFKRKKGVIYQAPRYDSLGNWPWTHPVEGGNAHPRFSYCYTSALKKRRCIGFARRRRGRGGRTLFDRAWTQFENFDEAMKPDPCKSSPPNGILSNKQSRVPPWPHYKPLSDSSDDDDSPKTKRKFRGSTPSGKDPPDASGKHVPSLFHRSYQSTSKLRVHPYTTHNSLVNNQVFLASITASLGKANDLVHMIIKKPRLSSSSASLLSPTKSSLPSTSVPVSSNNLWNYSGLSISSSMSYSHAVTQSPTRLLSAPPSTAPSSAVYQLNFPISVSPPKSTANSSVPVTSSNIMHRKTPNTDLTSTTVSSVTPSALPKSLPSSGINSGSITISNNNIISNNSSNVSSSNRVQPQILSSQTIVSRQQLSVAQQAYINKQNSAAQQQQHQEQPSQVSAHPVKANSLPIVNTAARTNKLSISKGLTITNSPTVSNGINPGSLHHARLGMMAHPKKATSNHL